MTHGHYLQRSLERDSIDSMNSAQLTDLKDFITSTVREEVGGLREEMLHGFHVMNKRFQEVNHRFDKVDERFEVIDERFDEVLDAIGQRFDDSEGVLNNHEKRIARLEKRTA